MSFFPKFHEYVIFISIFGQLLNIWTDDGRRGKHTGCGSGCCPDCVSELYQKRKETKIVLPAGERRGEHRCVWKRKMLSLS